MDISKMDAAALKQAEKEGRALHNQGVTADLPLTTAASGEATGGNTTQGRLVRQEMQQEPVPAVTPGKELGDR
jgi:C-terminal processing protease CtpA/Prc